MDKNVWIILMGVMERHLNFYKLITDFDCIINQFPREGLGDNISFEYIIVGVWQVFLIPCHWDVFRTDEKHTLLNLTLLFGFDCNLPNCRAHFGD